MQLKDYQKKAKKTALYPKEYKIIYPALGLGNEAGEVLGKIKKWLRGDSGKKNITKEQREDIKGELGDALWYIAVLADDINISLDDVAKYNLEKLASRNKRGVLKGNGDNR